MPAPARAAADEPTASLDPATAAEILDLLGAVQLEVGFGLLAVTHDVRAATIADRVLGVEVGRLA